MNSNKPLTLLSHDKTDNYTDSLSSCKMSVSDFKSQSEQSIDAYNDKCDDRNTTKNKIKIKTLCTFKILARMFEFIFATESSIMNMARIGLAMRPTE